jgi:O-antigen ligase
MFFVLISCLAVLLLRPQDFAAGMEDTPLFLGLLLLGSALAGQEVLGQLSAESLLRNPVTLCVLGLLPAMVLSHLVHGRIYEARTDAVDFAKTVLLYLFVVAVVTTPERFEITLTVLVVCACLIVGMAVLQYHDIISVNVLRILEERQLEEDGDVNYLRRLCAHGLFSDPNDLCLLLVLGAGISLYKFTDPEAGSLRFSWLAPVALFLYALALTQSRGGLLGFLLAVIVFLQQRFGSWKAVALGAALLPALLFLFAGRQTNITSAEGDTGQDRIALWSEALALFQESPVFGIGRGEFVEQIGLVTHNSYLHGFAELGFIGGTCFLGSFFLSLYQLHRLPKQCPGFGSAGMNRFRPWLFAMLAGFAGGLMTLSRAYAVPTFLVLGLATAYLRLHAPKETPGPVVLDSRTVALLTLTSAGFLMVMYLFVRVAITRV